MSRRFVPIFLISASSALAQLDSNSVTVTASRSSTPQADQGLFVIYIDSDLNTALADVLAAVQPAGLTVSNFSSVFTNTQYVYTGNQQQTQLVPRWAFRLTVPVSGIKDTIATLTALENSVPKANKNLTVSFSLTGTQPSSQTQQSQVCDFAGLISDARAQAQTLAAAGGRTLAGILALSTSTSNTTGNSVSLYPNTSTSVPCSATVKFGLLGTN